MKKQQCRIQKKYIETYKTSGGVDNYYNITSPILRKQQICRKTYEARTRHQRCHTRVWRSETRRRSEDATAHTSRSVVPRGFHVFLADSRRREPTRLRLRPIRAELGRLEPYRPKWTIQAEIQKKKKKKVQNASFDLYLNLTSAHFTQMPKHKLSTFSHISSLTRLCALCLSASVSSPLWLWDTQPLGTHSVYCFNSFFLQLSLTHS